MGEQILVLCSALKWRVAIVAQWWMPMAKPARVWPLGTTGWTTLTQIGWVLWQVIWSGLPLHQFKKRLAVKAFLLSMYKMGRFFKRSFHPRITVRSLLLVLVGIQTPIMCSNFVYFSLSIITCSFDDHRPTDVALLPPLLIDIFVAIVAFPVKFAATSDLVVVVVETALVVFGVDKSFQIDSCHYQYLALLFLHHHDYFHVFSVLSSFGFEIWVSTLQ